MLQKCYLKCTLVLFMSSSLHLPLVVNHLSKRHVPAPSLPWLTLILYSSHWKCSHFLAGTKIHKTAGITRVIEKSGKSFTLKGENEAGLKKEIQAYMDHANEVRCFTWTFSSAKELAGNSASLSQMCFLCCFPWFSLHC